MALIYISTRQFMLVAQPDVSAGHQSSAMLDLVIMARRIALLTVDQPASTPYAAANKYVKKAVARMLLRRAEVEYISDEIVRERPVKRSLGGSVATSVDDIKRFEASRPQKVHQKIWKATKLDVIPETGSLDLNYPEALRTTVIHPHYAMKKACEEAAERKRSNA